MLVQFNREDDILISINPAEVAVMFSANDAQPVSRGSDDDEDSDTFGEDDGIEDAGETAPAAEPQGHCIVRFRDGKGFKVKGSYEAVKAQLGAVNLVEFQRDNNKPILFNPITVAAVFGSERSPEISLVRLPDGRGFKVRGPYSEVHAKLANAGLLN